MYLKRTFIENSGPLRSLDLALLFSDNGFPRPLVLVGGNGGGKTNFLSLVADALFEAAAVHYGDVLPQKGLGRSWFRVVGGRSLTVGTTGGFSLLEFDDAGEKRIYCEKAGTVDRDEAIKKTTIDFSSQALWEKDGSHKSFHINDERSQKIFMEGVYSYFPSSRSEPPYWLNREAVPDVNFDTRARFSKNLNKPIYIERALDSFKQWLMGLISDARCDLSIKVVNKEIKFGVGTPSISSIAANEVLSVCNGIIQLILDDSQVRFVWMGRGSSDKVAIAKGNELYLPSLDALSSGQSILLGIFGTILRYGDVSESQNRPLTSSIEGICIIDEVDAHIHVDLQYRILPKLISMFPKIQFLTSSHSPLFALGMEKEFGIGSVQIVEMPFGTSVGSEAYSEFGRALQALASTGAFTDLVIKEIRENGRPIIYVEGETDAPYLIKAATLLGKEDLLDQCDIEWIGNKDKNGQAFHTGDSAMRHTLSVLSASPNLSNRNIMLLFDNDSSITEKDLAGIRVRKLPINRNNTIVSAGIENLLSEKCISDKFYQIKHNLKPNGDQVTTRTLIKMDLCNEMCSNGTMDEFSEFAGAISIIEEYLSYISSQ